MRKTENPGRHPPPHLGLGRKADDETDACNYRPISLLSNANRIFEKNMCNRMKVVIEKHQLLYSSQYSFRQAHSTEHAILDRRFSFECRKVIGIILRLLRYTIGLKNSRQFFIQSEVKSKPIVTHSNAFSCPLRQLPVITSSFDWFTVLCVFFVIG